MTSLYELTDTLQFERDEPVSLDRYEGKVLLVYNSAAL